MQFLRHWKSNRFSSQDVIRLVLPRSFVPSFRHRYGISTSSVGYKNVAMQKSRRYSTETSFISIICAQAKSSQLIGTLSAPLHFPSELTERKRAQMITSLTANPRLEFIGIGSTGRLIARRLLDPATT
jgi:hypothetical protein